MKQIVLQWIAIGVVLAMSAVSLVMQRNDGIKVSNTYCDYNSINSTKNKSIKIISIQEFENQWNEINQTYIDYSCGDFVNISGKIKDVGNDHIVIGKTSFYCPYGYPYFEIGEFIIVSIKIKEYNNCEYFFVMSISW